jgi:SOS response associated peptidase (SRAP)
MVPPLGEPARAGFVDLIQIKDFFRVPIIFPNLRSDTWGRLSGRPPEPGAPPEKVRKSGSPSERRLWYPTAMCGRFTQSYTWRELVELYRLTQAALNLQPRYNIAPTTTIDVLRLAETGPELVPMRWGLIPGWWKKTAKEVTCTFNARAPRSWR